MFLKTLDGLRLMAKFFDGIQSEGGAETRCRGTVGHCGGVGEPILLGNCLDKKTREELLSKMIHFEADYSSVGRILNPNSVKTALLSEEK